MRVMMDYPATKYILHSEETANLAFGIYFKEKDVNDLNELSH